MNVSSVTNHFTTANKGFITTLGGSITASAVTVPLTSVSGLTNGSVFTGIIEPGTAKEQEFTGLVDTAGVQITGVKWTDGTDVDHAAGSTIVDYVSTTGQNMMVKGILEHANQDGSLITQAVKDALAIGDQSNAGWEINTTSTITNVVNNGNRSYTLTHSASVAAVISEGMRRRFQRTVATNTYMGGLFNGSSHYFTKTTPSGTLGTVTNNFTIEAYVQPTVYQDAAIVARTDAAINNSISLIMRSTGVVRVIITNTAAANFRLIDTYQSLPLNKKTHVAASWTSGTVVIYFDGVSVPVAAATGGTAPTVAGTGGDFSIGRRGASAVEYFPGYISNVAVFDAVLSAATIREHATRKLLGNETNCIGAWSLDNTANDQSSAGNNLTATGGVGFSNVSPFGNNGKSSTLEYGLTMSVSADGLTEVVQVPEGCALPTAITSQDYSTQGNPFGWPEREGMRMRHAYNHTQPTLSATTQDLANSGAAINLGVGKTTEVQVTVGMTIGSSADFEFRPEIRVDGTVVHTMDYTAAAGIVGSRSTFRQVTYPVTLTAGNHILSAGVFIAYGATLATGARAIFIAVTLPAIYV